MYCRYYNEYRNLAENFTLIVDTREQPTPRFEDRIAAFESMGVKIERQALNVGDYSAIVSLPNGRILDFTDQISVERKMDIKELICCFTTKRERFENELLRAQVAGCKLYVATESGCYDDLVTGNYPNNAPSQSLLYTYHTYEERYDANFKWVTPETFPVFAYHTLRRFILDYLMTNYPNGEILQ